MTAAKKPTRGRPVIPAEEKENYYRISVNVPAELGLRIDAAATKTHRTKTGLVIWAMEELLKEIDK